MTPFGFASAARIRFGRGVISEAPEAIAARGRRVFLVLGKSGRFSDQLIAPLMAKGL